MLLGILFSEYMLDRKEKCTYFLFSIYSCAIHCNITTSRDLLDETRKLIRSLVIDKYDVAVINSG